MELEDQFRRSVSMVTICETVRSINDLCQSDSDNDKEIRRLLAVTLGFAKKMNAKLIEYKKDYSKGWWELLPKSERKRLNKTRQDAGYKCLE